MYLYCIIKRWRWAASRSFTFIYSIVLIVLYYVVNVCIDINWYILYRNLIILSVWLYRWITFPEAWVPPNDGYTFRYIIYRKCAIVNMQSHKWSQCGRLLYDQVLYGPWQPHKFYTICCILHIGGNFIQDFYSQIIAQIIFIYIIFTDNESEHIMVLLWYGTEWYVPLPYIFHINFHWKYAIFFGQSKSEVIFVNYDHGPDSNLALWSLSVYIVYVIIFVHV